jgi:uncharacterized protein YbaP (TraB family)
MKPSLRACCSARLLLLALIAALAASTSQVTAQVTAQTRNFLWKASGKQGIVYLVGSVHMLSTDYYPLSPALDSAFRASDLLIEELDFGEVMASDSQLALLTKGMMPSGQSLDAVISPETMGLVTKRVQGLGLPIEPLKRFKPWALALTLLAMEWQAAGFDAQLGLDKHFYDLATAAHKPVKGLETVAFQISRFNEMTMPDQDGLLAETLKELETETASVTALANAWKAGDVTTVEKIVLQDMKSDRRMYERLVVERNRTWLPQIEALFARSAPAFIVVGAAHLVGPDGIINALKARGYTVQQL